MTDSSGVVSTAPAEQIIVVRGRASGLAVDRTVIATGSGSVKTARFSTPAGRQTLLALVGSDGPAQSERAGGDRHRRGPEVATRQAREPPGRRRRDLDGLGRAPAS